MDVNGAVARTADELRIALAVTLKTGISGTKAQPQVFEFDHVYGDTPKGELALYSHCGGLLQLRRSCVL